MKDEPFYILESRMFKPYEDWGTTTVVFRTLQDALEHIDTLSKDNVTHGCWDFGFTYDVYKGWFGETHHEREASFTYYFQDREDDVYE